LRFTIKKHTQKQELELYDSRMLDKPAILCINKCDTDINGFKYGQLMDKLNRRREILETLPHSMRPEKLIDFMEILPISAKNLESTTHLKAKLREYLDLIDEMRRKHTNLQLQDGDGVKKLETGVEPMKLLI